MIFRQRTLAAVAVILVILFSGMTAAAQSVSIQFEGGVFRVNGWRPPAAAPAAGWSSVFAVFAGPGDVPSLLGSYSIDQNALVFRPKFPIEPGVRYRAVFRAPGAAPIERIFNGPAKDTKPAAYVVQIYPSGDVLQSNQLRLYIYFSGPMSRGVVSPR